MAFLFSQTVFVLVRANLAVLSCVLLVSKMNQNCYLNDYDVSLLGPFSTECVVHANVRFVTFNLCKVTLLFLGLWHENMSVLDLTESCCFPECGVIWSGRSVPSFLLFGSYNFILLALYFNIIKIVTIKKGPLRFILYLPLQGFCIGVPIVGLSTGRNM